MKRTLLSLIASLAVAGSVAAAQSQQPSSQPSSQQPSAEQPRTPGQSSSASQSQQKSDDVTLTGCLVQGSSPSVFILENAKTSTDPATSKGKSYIVQASAGTDLKQHLNHQVRIVGSEAEMSSSGSSMSGSSSAGSSSSQPGSSSSGSSSSQPGSSSSSSQPGSSSSGSSSSSAGQSASGASSQSGSQSTAAEERSMPRLSARTVTMVANTCPAA